MNKLNIMRQQRNVTVIVSPSVLPITDDWASAGGKLAPNLVRSSGIQSDRKKGQLSLCSAQTVFQYRFLRLRGSFRNHKCFAFLFVPLQPMTQNGLPFVRYAVNHCKILFLKTMRPNLFAEFCRRPFRARVNHHAANRAIKPMHTPYARIRFPQCVPEQIRHSTHFIG